jgi:hypothetical protein
VTCFRTYCCHASVKHGRKGLWLHECSIIRSNSLRLDKSDHCGNSVNKARTTCFTVSNKISLLAFDFDSAISKGTSWSTTRLCRRVVLLVCMCWRISWMGRICPESSIEKGQNKNITKQEQCTLLSIIAVYEFANLIP